MIRFLFLILVYCSGVAGILGCGKPAPPPAAEHFVFVADGISGERREAALEDFARLYTTLALPGEPIHLVRTPSHEHVVSVVVPRGDANIRLRDGMGLEKVHTFFAEETGSKSSQVDMPQIATKVAELRTTNLPPRITLVGDPCYNMPQHAGFAMTDHMVPTDGSLESPVSPFFEGVVHFPAGTQVVWVTDSAEWGSDSIHREYVSRFLRLFFQTYGAELCRLTSDAESGFRFTPSQFEGVVDPRDDGVGAWNTKRSSERRFIASGPSPAVMIERSPDDTNAAMINELLMTAEAQPELIVLAINWQSPDPTSDIDMHVVDVTTGEELFFLQKTTSFGKLFRDVRCSGNTEDDADVLGKWEAAQINHDRLSDLRLWLHSYSATAPSTVRVIAVWRGERKEALVEMPPSTGDPGQDGDRRTAGWRRISLGGNGVISTRNNAASNSTATAQR